MATNKRKSSTSKRTKDGKERKISWRVSNPPKYVSVDTSDMHLMQSDIVELMQSIVEEHQGCYFVAPPGTGKTSMIPKMFRPCVEETTVLNVATLPSMSLIDETRKEGFPSSVPPPFSPFLEPKEDDVRTLLDDAEPGQTVAITVTHDFLRKKLHPTKVAKSRDMARFVRDVGCPAVLRIVVDEAHNLCSEQWAERMAQAREQVAATTRIEVVLVSATPELHLPRFLTASARMLGVEPALLQEDEGAAARAIAAPSSPEAVAQFFEDTCPLPAPNKEWDVADLPAPYPNDALQEQLEEPLQDLATIVVGDLLYLLEAKMAGKTQRNREIHAINARKNLVAEILAIVAHHSPDGDGTKGGHVFAALRDRAKTVVVRGGAIDGRKAKKDASESVLIVHSTKRGVNKHLELLDELDGGANGVPVFEAYDLSTPETNAAQCAQEHDAFFGAFQSQASGHGLAMVTPKQVEGTSKFTTILTKILLIGPMDAKTMEQSRGRSQRPLKLAEFEGKRVRYQKTVLYHWDSSWAKAIATLTRFNKGGELSLICDAPDDVVTRLRNGPAHAPEVGHLLEQMALRLAMVEGRLRQKEADPLLPGRLVNMFLTLVEDDAARAKFMSKKDGDDEGEQEDDGEDDQPTYWGTVDKWMLEGDGATKEEAKAKQEDEEGEEDDEAS